MPWHFEIDEHEGPYVALYAEELIEADKALMVSVRRDERKLYAKELFAVEGTPKTLMTKIRIWEMGDVQDPTIRAIHTLAKEKARPLINLLSELDWKLLPSSDMFAIYALQLSAAQRQCLKAAQALCLVVESADYPDMFILNKPLEQLTMHDSIAALWSKVAEQIARDSRHLQ